MQKMLVVIDYVLAKIVRSDIRTTLDSAREHSAADEISGHAVLDAISRVWRRLRASQIDLWGEDARDHIQLGRGVCLRSTVA
jgi:hypothetical protein